MAEVIRRSAIKLGAPALLLFAIISAARAGDDHRHLDLGNCDIVQAPAGHKVHSTAYAEGVQIYRWDGTTWTFVAPVAVLYSGHDEDDDIVGIHYAGPTWESCSGSKVVGAVDKRCNHDPDSIPWLLLRAVSSEGPGIYRKVSYIQRLYTTGGLAPAEPGDFVGDEVRVPYTAWYIFYRGKK